MPVRFPDLYLPSFLLPLGNFLSPVLFAGNSTPKRIRLQDGFRGLESTSVLSKCRKDGAPNDPLSPRTISHDSLVQLQHKMWTKGARSQDFDFFDDAISPLFGWHGQSWILSVLDVLVPDEGRSVFPLPSHSCRRIDSPLARKEAAGALG